MIKSTLLAAALLAAGASHAATVTQWNFNSTPSDSLSSTGTLTPNIGSGTASLLGGTTATFASGDANGGSTDPVTAVPVSATNDSGWNLSTFATQGTGDKTRGAQFAVSTVGLQGISFSYDLRHSNTAPRTEVVQYSLDGFSFVDIATFSGPLGDTWFNNRSVDLSSITSTDDNASLAFRVVAAFEPSTSAYSASTGSSTYSTAGTWRFDMVTVSAVPEPQSLAMLLAGLGLVGSIAIRRRAR